MKAKLRRYFVLSMTACACLFALALQSQPAMHTLTNGCLTVKVMDPNAPDRYNTGVRFSPVANVLQVDVDGREYLFSPETHDPVTENGGLAMEFDLGGKDGPQPVSFAAAEMGESFVKIGVGVLKKTTAKYEFYTQYPIMERAVTRAEWTSSSATFAQTCPGVNDLAYDLGANITLSGNTLRIRYTLKNTGRRAFSTEHYTHNYFLFSGQPVGPGYALHFETPLPDDGVYDGARREGKTLHFDQILPKAVNLVVPVSREGQGDVWRSLTAVCSVTKQSIHVSNTFPVSRIAVHATSRYLCPEQFVLIRLAPGETTEWERSFTFHKNVTSSIQDK